MVVLLSEWGGGCARPIGVHSGASATSAQMELEKVVLALPMLDLRRLKTFREVAVRRSFSEAALALDYTQSTVSQQITTLEEDLGVTLLDRTHRPVMPTGAGELVLEHAEDLLGRAVAVEEALAALSGGQT